MINSVYTYDKMIREGYEVNDYTSVYYGGLLEVFNQYPNYFTSYKINIDDKMESISYDLYGSENYADVILASNNDVFLWNMPYNTDIVLDQLESFTNIIKNELGEGNINQDILEVFSSIEDENNFLNSKKRDITVPKSSKLNEVLALINNYRADNDLNDEDQL